MSFISYPSTSNRDSVAGCVAPSHGLAEGCAATVQNPYSHGVSGVLPCDMDRGLDSITIAAAPSQNEDADQGSGVVDIDALPDVDPDDAEVGVPVSATERLNKSAAALSHLLFHIPKNFFARDVLGQGYQAPTKKGAQ
eukprot:9321794-Pyramimonas_sp.AAC.1